MLTRLSKPEEIEKFSLATISSGTKSLFLKMTNQGLIISDSKNVFLIPSEFSKNLTAILESGNIYKICFDGKHLYKTLLSLNVRTENIVDIWLGHKCLLAGRSLANLNTREQLLSHYLNINAEENENTSNESILISVKNEEALFKKIQQYLKDDHLLNVWRIECNAIQCFGDMEFFGQRINIKKWQSNYSSNLQLLQKRKEELEIFFDPFYERDADGNIDININSPDQLKEAFRRMAIRIDGKLIDSTDKNTQAKLHHLPVMKALRSYRSIAKRVSDFGIKFIEAADPNGMIHFKYDQYGTSTGRHTSVGGINALNIPDEKEFRGCFEAPPGYLLSVVDYSGIELAVLASLSGDKEMMYAFQNNIDIHCYASCIIYDTNVTMDSPLRKTGKAINFGINYGKKAPALALDLNSQGFNITVEEAEKLLQKYQSKFATAMQFLNDASMKAQTYKMLRLKSGRKRMFDVNTPLSNIAREGMNFPMQGTVADFMKIAMARLRSEMKNKGYCGYIDRMIYDELGVCIKEEHASEVHELQKRIMIESAEIYVKNVPIKVDGYISKTWR